MSWTLREQPERPAPGPDVKEDQADFELVVKVRLYGGGTAEEAAAALRDYNATFDVPGDREVEIIEVRDAPWVS